MPYEDIVYFGDSARYPYGPKSKGEVTSFSLQIVKYLKDLYDVKMVVVACNTASAFALAELERAFDGPIVGMIEPGARSLVSSADGDSIGVIGTLGTISSGAYQERIAQLAP
ncbi:glutamate racemase, partial [mine drainage metagenome]